MNTHETMSLYIIRTRGEVLQLAIEIEALLVGYIAKYFVDDEERQIELGNLVLTPRLPFEEKYQVFLFLVNLNTPEFKKAAPEYPQQLKDIIQYRNIFAHNPIGFEPDTETAFERVALLHFTSTRIKAQKH